jgi:hypothetical protein
MKRLTIAGICMALLVSVAALSAHDDYRIIGTIAKVTAKKLDVKQAKDGKIISMDLDGYSIVTRDKKKVDPAEMKAGRHVVVDARGDSIKELTIVEVRLVPAPTTK